MKSPSYGLTMRRDWGILPKCMYCEATNITKRAKFQRICGSQDCARKLNTWRKRKDKTA